MEMWENELSPNSWVDLNGDFMKDITFSQVEIDELVTKDPNTGEFIPTGEGCMILTGVDELDESQKVTVHYNLKTGVYTVVDYEGVN